MQPLTMNHGNFVVSLDFELMWGVRDIVTIRQYGKNIAGVHTVIPKVFFFLNQRLHCWQMSPKTYLLIMMQTCLLITGTWKRSGMITRTTPFIMHLC